MCEKSLGMEVTVEVSYAQDTVKVIVHLILNLQAQELIISEE